MGHPFYYFQCEMSSRHISGCNTLHCRNRQNANQYSQDIRSGLGRINANNAQQSWQDQNEGDIEQRLPYCREEQPKPGRPNGLIGDGHHIAQTEGGVQRHLGYQQPPTVVHNHRVVVKQQDQRLCQKNIGSLHQDGQK